MIKQIRISVLLVTAYLVLSSPNVLSETHEDAMHAMREGNFAEAYCMLRPLADAGDAEAQYNIGWMYLNGYGLSVNDLLALAWWEKASNQGYTDASFSLAMLYGLGEGQVKKDRDVSLDYYLLAIDDGHEDAAFIVKSMLLRNDKTIRKRSTEIMEKYATVFSDKRQISVKRANIRSGAGLEYKIKKVFEQGVVVYEFTTQGKWSQIFHPDDGEMLWVFSSLLGPYVESEVLIPH